ncbi:MAG: hypothetical protein ABIR79_19120, partial [Candidatus Binatia bacterium]
MTTPSHLPLSSLALVILLALTPATARAFKDTTADPPCAHPCARVAECPKVTCECAEASGSGVAACDTETTHCCVSAEVACARFCEVNNQTWTGRFTPEPAAPGAATGEQPPPPADGAASVPAPSAACSEPCEKAEDCRTMTCRCAKGAVPDVAACEPASHCCGSARVVCEHFCKNKKKGTWTGKTIDAPK